jgi:hypothetical protein
MTTFTKSTISNWTEWVYSEEYRSARDEALLVMINAGKTDGNREFGTGFLIRRNWIDQAAAEEWKNWITTHVPPEHLISIDIVDFSPE